MTIQDLGSVGEFVSAIAVLITLIYLAVQVRAIRVGTFVDSVAQTIQDTARLNALDIRHANLIVKAEKGGELTAEERFILDRIYMTHASFHFHQYLKVRELNPERVWFTSIRSFCNFIESNNFYMKLFEGYDYKNDPDENVVEFMALAHAELESRRNA